MYNKKILFIISNPSQFKNFFRNKLHSTYKECEISFLIYPYSFSSNKYLAKDVKQWIKSIKKKTLIKKIWYLDRYSYLDIKININANLKLLKIIKGIEKENFDILFVPPCSHYWEKIIIKYFNKKKIIGYLLSPPSGLDLFNSLNDFYESIKKKRLIFKTGKFVVKSDNNYLHQINTNSKNIKKNYLSLSFIYEKILIRINLIFNFIILPIYLNCFSFKTNNFYDKLNFNFFEVNKIVCFHPLLFNLLKKSYPKKKIYFTKLFIKNLNTGPTVQKDWIFLCNDTYYKSLDSFYKILTNLKKINKINKIFIKKHPTWESKNLDRNFYNKLNKLNIKYQILNKTKNIEYEKYYGIISEPSSVFLESIIYNSNINIIGISKNYQTTSGAISQFYKQIRYICWEPRIKNLIVFFNKKNLNVDRYLNFKAKDLNL